MTKEPAATTGTSIKGTSNTSPSTTRISTTGISTTGISGTSGTGTSGTSSTGVSGTGVSSTGVGSTEDAAIAAFGRRDAPAGDLVDCAADVVDAAFAMAARFHRGGKLLVFGMGAASTDAQHVAVEFVHPVIVGKRALPAISLTSDIATLTAIAASAGLTEIFAYQLRQLGASADIAFGISADGQCPSVLAGLRTARDAGLLTVALTGTTSDATSVRSVADHILTAGSTDPRVIKEIHVTIYHLLWELVHVFFEQPAVLSQGVGAL